MGTGTKIDALAMTLKGAKGGLAATSKMKGSGSSPQLCAKGSRGRMTERG